MERPTSKAAEPARDTARRRGRAAAVLALDRTTGAFRRTTPKPDDVGTSAENTNPSVVPGSAHEETGQGLLLAHGIAPLLASFSA